MAQMTAPVPPPADEQLEFVKLIAQRLESIDIPYMLTGSIALAIYATPRMTRDVDVVIACDQQSAERLASLFAVDSYVNDDAVRAAIRAHGIFNVIHQEWLCRKFAVGSW